MRRQAVKRHIHPLTRLKDLMPSYSRIGEHGLSSEVGWPCGRFTIRQPSASSSPTTKTATRDNTERLQSSRSTTSSQSALLTANTPNSKDPTDQYLTLVASVASNRQTTLLRKHLAQQNRTSPISHSRIFSYRYLLRHTPIRGI